MESNLPYEKLGLFYLGKELPIGDEPAPELPLLYKSKNLTTHGVIIGMTGSGKTGLGIGLIEEAIMDNVPSIIIDPKGDMANLLLTFPNLEPSDFQPWIDPAEASRKNMSVEQFADKTAKTWSDGLASWGQGKQRIQSLKEKSTLTVYTPGSSSGVPVSIMASFSAPADAILDDHDSLNALVGSTATSLLALVNIEGEPLTSREHILISSILLHYWRNNDDLSLETLIGAIVNPPFEKVGVFSLANFFPQKDRMKLAMLLNNVIASPSFSSWLQGQPMDIQKILYGEGGKPNTAIFSISHLSETERMFFVTLLLNAMISWMRRQQGTSSLKALLYMDEIFGYFPPTGNPPSKKPMLLLLKQARAFGVGVVLATQNPVDLDYKGLSNIGTWFVGRLQTTQDQDRVLEGIVGASDGNLNRTMVRKLLSDMKGRQFLLTSAHMEEPLLFETRWVMSYLKGPISQRDISKLMDGRQPEMTGAQTDAGNVSEPSGVLTDQPPMLHEGVDQRYHLVSMYSEKLSFEPWLAAKASLRFYNASRNIDEVKAYNLRLYLDEVFKDPDWNEAELSTIELDSCRNSVPDGSSFLALPSHFASLRNLNTYKKDFADYLYQSQRLELLAVKPLKMESRPGESEDDFIVRIADRLREDKEAAVEKLADQFQVKRERVEAKLSRALAKLDKEQGDVSTKTTDTIISFGTAVLGAFLGRKAVSSSTMTRTASSIRKAGRIGKEKDDVRRAEEVIAGLELEIEELETEQNDELEKLADSYDVSRVNIETFSIKPRRTDIFDVEICLLWGMVSPRIDQR